MKHIHRLHEAFLLFPVNAAVGLHVWEVYSSRPGPGLKWGRIQVRNGVQTLLKPKPGPDTPSQQVLTCSEFGFLTRYQT